MVSLCKTFPVATSIRCSVWNSSYRNYFGNSGWNFTYCHFYWILCVKIHLLQPLMVFLCELPLTATALGFSVWNSVFATSFGFSVWNYTFCNFSLWNFACSNFYWFPCVNLKWLQLNFGYLYEILIVATSIGLCVWKSNYCSFCWFLCPLLVNYISLSVCKSTFYNCNWILNV